MQKYQVVNRRSLSLFKDQFARAYNYFQMQKTNSQKSSAQSKKLTQKAYKVLQEFKGKSYKHKNINEINETIKEFKKFYSGTMFELQCLKMLIEATQNEKSQGSFKYNGFYNESFQKLNHLSKEIQSSFEKSIENKKAEQQQNSNSIDSDTSEIQFFIKNLQACDKKELFKSILPWGQDKQENIKGDFDIILENTQTISFHQKIIESLQKRSSKNSWFIQNYNNLKFFKQKQKQAIYVFQIKRNIKIDSKQPASSNEKLTSIVEKLKNEDLKKYLEETILNTRIISVLSQIIKNVLAVTSSQHEKWAEKLSFKNFLMQKSQTINDPPKKKLIIMFYLIINNNLKKQEITKIFDPFYGILNYWFKKLGVCLTIIGYNEQQEKSNLLDLQKVMSQVEQLKQKNSQLEERNSKLEERNSKLEEMMNEIREQNRLILLQYALNRLPNERGEDKIEKKESE